MNLLFRLNRLTLYLVGLAVLAYVVLIVINWNDRAPSATVLEFEASFEDRPAVDDVRNAYLFVFGFAGPPGAEPAALGIARRDWAVAGLASGSIDLDEDPLPAAYDYGSRRSAAVATLADACAEAGTTCFDALASDAAAAHEWLESERWLRVRYETLIDYAAFREALPFELDAPFPAYMPVLDGQRLLLITAWYSGRGGDSDRVAGLLQRDLEFWRMVLTNADSLIAKMIAAAAITRHFMFGNGALRELHRSTQESAMPPSWLAELGDDERSMRRTLIGEWRFMQNAMRSLQAGSEETPISDGDADFWDRMEWRLFSPLYQPQDFSNRYAELLAQLIELFRTPYSDLPAAYEKAADIHDGTPQPFRRAYNIIGDWLFSIAAPDFANYAARVSDLEGIRRAAVVTATLRARGLAPEDVPGSLAAAELANPYTDEPFAWLDDSKEVFFEGLYAGDRGRHRFPY